MLCTSIWYFHWQTNNGNYLNNPTDNKNPQNFWYLFLNSILTIKSRVRAFFYRYNTDNTQTKRFTLEKKLTTGSPCPWSWNHTRQILYRLLRKKHYRVTHGLVCFMTLFDLFRPINCEAGYKSGHRMRNGVAMTSARYTYIDSYTWNAKRAHIIWILKGYYFFRW